MLPKSVLITGCSPGGIGAALAKSFHLRGHDVFATGRSFSEIDPSLADLGIHTFSLDVTKQESIDSAVLLIQNQTGGKLEILINNAGILQVLPFADASVADTRQLFEVNFIAVWAMTQAFLPLLLKSKGLVATLGSVNEVFCPPFLAAYNASKAAVEAMMRTIRRELAPLGVRVVIIKTGSVHSGLFKHAPASLLPEGSLYAPLGEWIETRGFTASARFMDVTEYADAVAVQLVKDNPSALIWKGGLAFVARLIRWLGWETLLDSQMIKGNGLDRLGGGKSS